MAEKTNEKIMYDNKIKRFFLIVIRQQNNEIIMIEI